MNTGGYTKLFSLILSSSIWGEDVQTRVVWITMLALKDMRGIVNASVSGLARIANVSVDACQEAITKLEAPDPDSRTKDHDGRRIEPVPGGWVVLNHFKYRNAVAQDPETAGARERMKRFREKQAAPPSPPNTDNTEKTYTDTDTALQAVTPIGVTLRHVTHTPIKFKKPSLDEVKDYIEERHSNVDPELFYSHYEANGWVQGNRGKPVRNWKACVVTWEKGNFRFGGGKPKPKQTDYSGGF